MCASRHISTSCRALCHKKFSGLSFCQPKKPTRKPHFVYGKANACTLVPLCTPAFLKKECDFCKSYSSKTLCPAVIKKSLSCALPSTNLNNCLTSICGAYYAGFDATNAITIAEANYVACQQVPGLSCDLVDQQTCGITERSIKLANTFLSSKVPSNCGCSFEIAKKVMIGEVQSLVGFCNSRIGSDGLTYSCCRNFGRK